MLPVNQESVVFKICTKCKNNTPINNFYKQSKTSDGLNTWCKSCINSGMKEHARKRKRDLIILLGNKCNRCGGSFHQAAYDFHHTNPKEKETGIAKLLQSYAIDHPKVQQELEKCILLCSNCHRTLHSEEHDICEIGGKGGSCGV